MTGLLRGGAKRVFGSLLSAQYLEGERTRPGITYGTGGLITTNPGKLACRVKVDTATQRMREAEGAADTDRAIYVLADGLEPDDVAVGDHIKVLEGEYAGDSYAVASVDRPPGGSYFLCRGQRNG